MPAFGVAPAAGTPTGGTPMVEMGAPFGGSQAPVDDAEDDTETLPRQSGTVPDGGGPADTRSLVMAGARRNAVAAGAGVVLVAVLGTVVTLGMTSGGGEPRALAMSRTGCCSATSTCERATECSQPSTASLPSPSGSGGTPSFWSVRSTNETCAGMGAEVVWCDICTTALADQARRNEASDLSREASPGRWVQFNQEQGQRLSVVHRWLEEVADGCPVCHVRNHERLLRPGKTWKEKHQCAAGRQYFEKILGSTYTAIRQKVQLGCMHAVAGASYRLTGVRRRARRRACVHIWTRFSRLYY
jgi:hypothetical protein